MLETEFKKEIKKLSDNYSFAEATSSITGPKLLISYKGNTVLRIYKVIQYRYEGTIEQSDFYRLPYSNKLWMLVAEFAMTPVDKRFKENKSTNCSTACNAATSSPVMIFLPCSRP